MDLGGKKATRAFVYDGNKLRVDRIAWHRDTAYTVEIAKGAMLRVVERPEEGGHTDFCDTAIPFIYPSPASVLTNATRVLVGKISIT